MTKTRTTLAAVLACGMLAAAPAGATEWIYCNDVDAVVDVGFLLGSVGAFMPAGATMRYKTMHWTTNEAYGDGALMTVGQGFGDDGMLVVDLYDEAVDAKIAELRLWKAEEGEDVVNAGTLRILGQGAWAVSCDPS